jgi:hypothetical protein
MEFQKWLRLQWDRAGAWLCVAIGAVVLVLGWVGMSGTAYPAEQMPFMISGGVGGVFLLGLGAMLWLSADLRDEWQKLDRIEKAIRERGTLHVQPGPAGFEVPSGQMVYAPFQPGPPWGSYGYPTGQVPPAGVVSPGNGEPAGVGSPDGTRGPEGPDHLDVQREGAIPAARSGRTPRAGASASRQRKAPSRSATARVERDEQDRDHSPGGGER